MKTFSKQTPPPVPPPFAPPPFRALDAKALEQVCGGKKTEDTVGAQQQKIG